MNRISFELVSMQIDEIERLLRQLHTDTGVVTIAEVILTLHGWYVTGAPALDGPLLFDLGGMAPLAVARALVELQSRRPVVPTIVLVPASDRYAQRVAMLCSVVYAIAPDTLPLDRLCPWVRQVERIHDVRPSAITPCMLGATASAPSDVPREVLGLLAALGAAQSLEHVATACGYSIRTLHRRLLHIRTCLGLPDPQETRLAPEKLAEALIRALAYDGPPARTLAPRVPSMRQDRIGPGMHA